MRFSKRAAILRDTLGPGPAAEKPDGPNVVLDLVETGARLEAAVLYLARFIANSLPFDDCTKALADVEAILDGKTGQDGGPKPEPNLRQLATAVVRAYERGEAEVIRVGSSPLDETNVARLNACAVAIKAAIDALAAALGSVGEPQGGSA